MIVLKNAVIHTVANGTITGSVAIKDNKILMVGDFEIPENAEIVDCSGKHITPGFIDAHCHVGVFNEGLGDMGNDGNDATSPTTPQVKAADGIYPEDEAFQDAISNGVTTLCVGPGSANVIGGQMCVVKPISHILEKMLVTDYVGLKCAFGENPKRVYGSKGTMPETRMGVAAVLRKALQDADAYRIKRDFQLNKPQKDDEPKEPFIPEYDKEIIVEVLENKKKLRAHAHRMDDIQTAIRIAREFNVGIVIEHCTEGFKIADYLAKNNIPVIIGPINGTKPKVELKDATLESAKILDEAGVKFSMMTDAPVERIGSLFDDIRLAIRYGLNQESGLKAVTLNPAEILGMQNELGSIETGKSADLNIFSGDPFDFRSVVETVYINGKVEYKR